MTTSAIQVDLLNGQVAIVTGAGDGIGQGIAEEFVKHGATVVVADLDPAKSATVARNLNTRYGPGRAMPIPFDLGCEDSCECLVHQTMASFSRIDVLVNNAATWSGQHFWNDAAQDNDKQSDWKELERVFRVNLVGTMHLSRRVAEEMVKSEVTDAPCRGAVVQVTSIHQEVLRGFHFEYSVSKAGQRMFVKELAFALASQRIRVNGIAPGAIDTPGTRREDIEKEKPYVPLGGRYGNPAEIGLAAVFLASHEWSPYTTGAILEVSGALHLYSHKLDIQRRSASH